MTLETLDLFKKWEQSKKKLHEKIQRFKGQPPLPNSGLHVDLEKMAKDYEEHTDAEGRPPLRGAKDD